MTAVYSSAITPDPHDAAAVLAFVFCPPSMFGDDDADAVAELMAPAKAAAVMRWYEAHMERRRN